MRWISAAVVACSLLAGCAAFTPSAVKKQVEIELKVHHGTWAQWSELGEAQRARAYWNSTRAWEAQGVAFGYLDPHQVRPKWAKGELMPSWPPKKSP